MTLFHAALLGIVEGLTEYLPVSSTGHLILVSKLLGLPADTVLKSFEISIQAGAILAVVALYWEKFLFDFDVLKKITIAFIPTGIIGFLLYKIIKNIFLGSISLVLWSFFVGGLILILFETLYRERSMTRNLGTISYWQAFWIGVAQSIAVIPGVSRSAATIVGGMVMGLDRKTVVEFSFLLAVPTMLAATGYDMLKSAAAFSSADFMVIGVGFTVSFFAALLSVRFFLRYIEHHNFVRFGIYRVILASLFWII